MTDYNFENILINFNKNSNKTASHVPAASGTPQHMIVLGYHKNWSSGGR